MSISLLARSGAQDPVPASRSDGKLFAQALKGARIEEGPLTAEGLPPASTADIQAATARRRAAEAAEARAAGNVPVAEAAPRPSGLSLIGPGAIATAGALALADGPLPIGDVPALLLLAGAIGKIISASVSNENLEDGTNGVRPDLFPDAGVQDIEAGIPDRTRVGDLGDPNNAAKSPGPDVVFEQPAGARQPTDGLEAPVMISPPDNRPENMLPIPRPPAALPGTAQSNVPELTEGQVAYDSRNPRTNETKVRSSEVLPTRGMSEAALREVATLVQQQNDKTYPTVGDVLKKLRATDQITLVRNEEGNLIGTATLTKTGPSTYYVGQVAAGEKGAGGDVMAELVNRFSQLAKNTGKDTTFTFYTMDPANLKFYQKFGAEIVKEVPIPGEYPIEYYFEIRMARNGEVIKK